MKKPNNILPPLKICLIAALAIFACIRIGSTSERVSKAIKSLFSNKTEVRMLDTVIEDIRPIQEITTARYNAEIPLIKQYKTRDSILSIPFVREGEAAYIVKGEIRAGIDVREITRESLSMAGDTLYVRMPVVKVLDAIVNPSDITIFDHSGTIPDEDMSMYVPEAKARMVSKAIRQGILEQARESARNTLCQMFMACGFRTVIFTDPVTQPTMGPMQLPASSPLHPAG